MSCTARILRAMIVCAHYCTYIIQIFRMWLDIQTVLFSLNRDLRTVRDTQKNSGRSCDCSTCFEHQSMFDKPSLHCISDAEQCKGCNIVQWWYLLIGMCQGCTWWKLYSWIRCRSTVIILNGMCREHESDVHEFSIVRETLSMNAMNVGHGLNACKPLGCRHARTTSPKVRMRVS